MQERDERSIRGAINEALKRMRGVLWNAGYPLPQGVESSGGIVYVEYQGGVSMISFPTVTLEDVRRHRDLLLTEIAWLRENQGESSSYANPDVRKGFAVAVRGKSVVVGCSTNKSRSWNEMTAIVTLAILGEIAVDEARSICAEENFYVDDLDMLLGVDHPEGASESL